MRRHTMAPRKSLIVVRIGERIPQTNHRFAEDNSSRHLRHVGYDLVLSLEQTDITWVYIAAGCPMQQLTVKMEHIGKQTAA